LEYALSAVSEKRHYGLVRDTIQKVGRKRKEQDKLQQKERRTEIGLRKLSVKLSVSEYTLKVKHVVS
jgi:hypothetical protein